MFLHFLIELYIRQIPAMAGIVLEHKLTVQWFSIGAKAIHSCHKFVFFITHQNPLFSIRLDTLNLRQKKLTHGRKVYTQKNGFTFRKKLNLLDIPLFLVQLNSMGCQSLSSIGAKNN